MADITGEVRRLVRESGTGRGTCHLFVPHTTAGITINENADPAVRKDLLAVLDRLVPTEGPYEHGEGNSHAHAKASLVGSSVTLLVEAGQPVLGTWQAVYLCEFDGPRTRNVILRVTPA
jgi:secondary thiamine-phosphate synthase enzyme